MLPTCIHVHERQTNSASLVHNSDLMCALLLPLSGRTHGSKLQEIQPHTTEGDTCELRSGDKGSEDTRTKAAMETKIAERRIYVSALLTSSDRFSLCL
jgi:hypothetical protein